MSRTGHADRRTKETSVRVSLALDGGETVVVTPVPFLNHLLDQVGTHGRFGLHVEATGDVEVDAHHLVEDVGIVLGRALSDALGDRVGIARFADRTVPLDESLVQVILDCSGRGMAVLALGGNRSLGLGSPAMYVEHAEELLRALAREAGLTLHVRTLVDGNTHHQLEAAAKGLALALRDAVRLVGEAPVSTKGTLVG
jgi:imidazoleglycerol-phosphate dehydratase